jgi:hypothetical protein
MLDALELLMKERQKMEDELRRIESGPAYVAMNGLTHWGATLHRNTEKAILDALLSTIQTKETP